MTTPTPTEARKILAEFKPVEARTSAAHQAIHRLGLDNCQALIDPRVTTRRFYAYEAAHLGRYAGNTSGGVSSIVEVPFTDEETAALIEFRTATEAVNALWPAVKVARKILSLLAGKRMLAKFPGTSALSGQPFQAGTEIFYSNTDEGRFAAPCSELEEKP